ncbi:uncharacterized protein LOC131043587 isoform X2 [Cryptomeria japonica]|uniref:uncharacterized protein LOC131043587 isoform X2 n=1 Tax=Cryptomeria japonica TaxID=3369 RepID=UPI0027DA82CC|nr:uncharacterized protein LOC131043587 isoform X2 [Cryptomeria japonica]
MLKGQSQTVPKPIDKIDLRFLLKATRVPPSCDKLVVSIFSVETGKAVARTNKALVRSGTCQWSEAVSESVRFLQDDISKELEEKLFKFVVSPGSPRSGILGEATINLADYLSSKLPVPLSLPLKKCNHGTILHVKIHCLSPRVESREPENLRENTTEQDDQNSVSDDTDNKSEGSDHMIAGSVGSSSGNRLGRGVLQNKDGASSPSSSRFSSDSGEVLLSGSGTANGNSKNVLHGGLVSSSDSAYHLHRRHDSGGSRDGTATSRTGNGQDSYRSSPSSPFNGKGTGSAINLQKHSKGFLETAEATIQELRTEAMTWERNARKLGAEMEMLKHQFSEQTKHNSDLEIELSAVEVERDNLKLEVEQVKSALQASTERESALNNTRFDVDDAKRTVKELQEEIELQKQSNANLDLQLRKTQDSNMELVSALQELEETIEQQNAELEKFSEEKQKQDNEGVQLHTEIGLQLSQSKVERDNLKKEVEELRSAMQASMASHSIGDAAGIAVENAEFIIQKLQEEIEINKTANNHLKLELQKTEESYNRVVSVAQDLEERLKQQDIDHLSSANRRFEASTAEVKLQSIEAEWMQKLSLKEEEIRKLEAQISNSEIQKPYPNITEYRDESKEDLHKSLEISKREIEELERDCKELTDENMELIYKMNRLNKYLESKNISIAEVEEQHFSENSDTLNALHSIIKTGTSMDEVEIDGLKSKVAHLEASLDHSKNEVFELQKQNSGLEIEFERRVQEMASKHDAYASQIEQKLESYASREKHLQGTIDQLELVNVELQADIQKLKEEQRSSRSSMEELQFQLSLHTEEAQSLRSSKCEFEMQVSNLQMEKVNLEDELQITQEEIKTAKRKAVELDSTKEELERHITDLEVENVQLSERILGLEAQLRYITEERESYKLDVENAKSHGIELQTNLHKLELDLREEITKLQDNLRESESKLSRSLEEAEFHKREHQKTHLKLDVLMKEYTESKSRQEQEILDLSASCANREEQLDELRGQLSFSVQQVKSLESEVAILQKDMAKKEKVWSVEMEALLVSSKENEQAKLRSEEALSQVRLEKATTVQQLENEVQRLTEQMSSTFDEKEGMATKALIEASELRAEKVKLEDSLHQTQGKVRQYEMELSSVRQDYENKVQDLIVQITTYKEKEQEMNFRQENTNRQLKEAKLSEENFKQRVQDLEKKIQHIETEKRKLKDEQIDLSSKAHEIVNLRAEMDNLRSTLEDIMAEKLKLENSLQFADAELERLRAEKLSLVEKGTMMQVAISEGEGLKRSKAALEEKLLRLQTELSAKEASSAQEAGQKNESTRLKRLNSKFQRNLQDLEEERKEYKGKVKSLEEELKLRTDALSKAEQKVLSMSNGKTGHTSPSRDTKEMAELREKLWFAESGLASLAKEFEAKEKDLCDKIRYLENANKQFKQPQGDSKEDHLQLELTRLQKEISSLSQREYELLTKLGAQELLQKEVEKLKEVNKHLQSQHSRFKETKSGDMVDRVLALETELAEALESNAMYKSQLKSFLGHEQNVHVAALQNFGSVDQVVNDLTRYKRTTSSLETELKDMRERYFQMSLRYAEVEAKREELVMQVKNLKNGKRWF